MPLRLRGLIAAPHTPMHADGSFGAPQPMTARNAVASTFGLTGAEYMPETET